MALRTIEFARAGTGGIRSCLMLSLLPLVSACATVPLQQTGSLSSYERLRPADSKFNGRKSRVHVDKDAVLAANTVFIVPNGTGDWLQTRWTARSASPSAIASTSSRRPRQLTWQCT
jgi:hypothetical protein